MTKYELVEEINEVGETIYFIEKDGQYLEGSAKVDLERAKEVYEQIIKVNRKKEKTVLKSIEL